MKRFLLVLLLGLAALPPARAAAKPNFVWIIADDLSPEQGNLRHLT